MAPHSSSLRALPRRLAAGTSVILLPLSLAACGGGGDNNSTPTPPTTVKPEMRCAP